jgi:tungstate transport system permease protein
MMPEALVQAVKLLIAFDRDLYRVIGLSLLVSGTSVVLATMLGVPAGTWFGLQPYRRVRWPMRIVYTLMGLPPVVGGLVVYMLISRRGMLGPLNLLFTPGAMIMAQTLLALPIVTGLTAIAVRARGKAILETLQSLGAGRLMILLSLVREARYGILGAVIAGFGRVIAEVGAVMMVGGNIEGHTRVLTTAIVLETRKGNFAFAMALGAILMILAFIFNAGFYRLLAGESEGD